MRIVSFAVIKKSAAKPLQKIELSHVALEICLMSTTAITTTQRGWFQRKTPRGKKNARKSILSHRHDHLLVIALIHTHTHFVGQMLELGVIHIHTYVYRFCKILAHWTSYYHVCILENRPGLGLAKWLQMLQFLFLTHSIPFHGHIA